MPAERPDEGGVVLRLDYVSDSGTPRRVVPVGVCPVCKGPTWNPSRPGVVHGLRLTERGPVDCRNNVLEVP